MRVQDVVLNPSGMAHYIWSRGGKGHTQSRKRQIVGRLPLRTAIAAVLAGASTRGVAQPPALEEIIVTAERHETSLQKTPISIAVVTADTMELKGLETLEDVATVIPNFDIKGTRGSGNTLPAYQIRGLASGSGGVGERAAALYIDGIYIPHSMGHYMSVLDIDRIEVLRGPQGTLFGRNSTGGAIRVFTKQPGPERHGHVRLTMGDFDRQDASAMVNVPLSTNMFFRVQGGSLRQDGYVRRGSQELGGSEETLASVRLLLEPSTALRITFGLSAMDSEAGGTPEDVEMFDMKPNLDYEGNRADWLSDYLQAAGQARITPDNDSRIVLDDFATPSWCFLDDANPDWDTLCETTNGATYEQFDANVSLDVNDTWTFTSLTGLSAFEAYSSVGGWLGGTVTNDHEESDVEYQELQLNATFDRFDLVTGISYFREDRLQGGIPSYQRQGSSTFTPQAANGNTVAAGGLGPNGLFVTGTESTFQDAWSGGVFANLTWHIKDRLNFTPGIRWAHDWKEVTQTRDLANDFIPFGGLSSETVHAEDDWNSTDYRLTLDYRVADNLMVYVTSSEAHRAGAYSYSPRTEAGQSVASGEAQTAAIASGLLPAFTSPEKVHNDEIGARTTWLDGRLRVNLTYFDMAYTDRQGFIQVPDPVLGLRRQLVTTGDVDLSGYELEGQIAATNNLMIDFSAGSLDSTVKDPCANNGDFLSPGAPEDSYSLGGRLRLPLQRGADLTLGLSYAHTGPQQTIQGGTSLACFNPVTGAPNPVPNWGFDTRYELPEYALVNGRVRYTSASGNWELTVFGNNLTDEVYGSYGGRSGGAVWDAANPTAGGGIAAPERSSVQVTRGRPREYGVTFQYNFGTVEPRRR
jgi:iron complex outermembrane receptor protein